MTEQSKKGSIYATMFYCWIQNLSLFFLPFLQVKCGKLSLLPITYSSANAIPILWEIKTWQATKMVEW